MRLFTLRGPVLRVPWPLVLLAWAARGTWVGLRWLAAHRHAAAGVAAPTLGLWWVAETGRWLWLLAVLGCIGATFGGVMAARPAWWVHLQETLASWRRRRWYEERWELALNGAGLMGVDEVPTLMSHRFGGAPGERDLDVLTVKMAAGQLSSDWRQQALRLAGTWELQRLRVHPVPGQPRDVQLFGRRHGARPYPPAAERIAHAMDVPVELVAEPSPAARDDASSPAEPDASPPPARTTRPRGAFPRTPRSAR